MSWVGKNEPPLIALAAYLADRREAMLRSWRKAIDRDPKMTTGAALPRTQLNDHIPQLLERFGEKLLAAAGDAVPDGATRHEQDAAAHRIHVGGRRVVP